MSDYVAVLESDADVKTAEAWAKDRTLKKLKVIALSLDALEAARAINSFETTHVWDILQMEDIIDRAFWDADTSYAQWVGLHATRADNYLDIASRYKMHVEFLSHAAARLYVREALAEIFSRENQLCYWPEAPRRHPLCGFYGHVAYEIVHAIYDRIRGKQSINRTLRDTPTGDILISGWGRDISRSIDIDLLAKKSKEASLPRIVNVIWRAAKLKKVPEATGNFTLLSLRETLKNGTSYGPAFSLFSPVFWLKQFAFYNRAIKPRLDTAKKHLPQGSLLRKLLQGRAFESEFIFNILFAHHDAYLSREAMNRILERVKPKLFVGSDSGGVSARSELLVAKRYGAFTFSTPHGYQAYGMPEYNYLADSVLTHAPATARILNESGVAKERIGVVGTSHLRRESSMPIDSKRVRLVLGTRSWGGKWSNYCSRHDEYDRQLNLLLDGVQSDPNLDMTIKSHPNGDLHAYYNLLQKKFRSERIRHIPQGWKLDQFIELTDILICFEMPSLYVSALYLKIPIIFINGAMTKTQGKLHYDYRGLGAVVRTATEALQEVKKISTSTAYYDSIMAKQNAFAKEYDTAHPEERLIKLLAEKL